jgi:hypothetical protein
MLREQLRRWLRSLRHGVHLLPLNEPQASRAAVRSAYRRVLSLAYEQGLARKPGQTPQDYATALAAVAPRLREPLCVLTEAYDAARYAPSPPGATEVAAARAASAEIEALLFAHETERAPQAPDQAPGNLKAG